MEMGISMQIHQILKNAMSQHKKKIELIQWDIISGVSSLVYSEYIRRIKQKSSPIRAILVPEIRVVQDLLNADGHFINLLSENLIDNMMNHFMIKESSTAPELVLFQEENIEIMKTIFDLYIIPNIIKNIPETIELKFGLNKPTQQIIRQDRDIVLFERRPISDDQLRFVVDQSVLQLLVLLPTMKKTIEIPEDNCKIFMNKHEILTIGNSNAICPIHFNDSIISNRSVIELLSFVTDTNISRMENKTTGVSKNGHTVEYYIRSNMFNQVGLTTFEGIELPTTEKE